MKGKWRTNRGIVVIGLLAIVAGFAVGTAQRESTVTTLSEIGFRPSGYPIVDTPVSIETVIVRGAVNPVAYSELTLIQQK